MVFNSRQEGGSVISLNYTYQNAMNELTDTRASDVPRHKLNASFNYRPSRYINAYAGLNHRGELKRADGDGRPTIGGHTTLDLALNIKGVSDSWNVTASMYNVLDKTYYDSSSENTMRSDYTKAGRSFFLEVCLYCLLFQ